MSHGGFHLIQNPQSPQPYFQENEGAGQGGSFTVSAWRANLQERIACLLVASDYTKEDLVFCFKLTIWDLQCKYADLVERYTNKLKFGENCKDLFVTLKTFKRGLEVLNNYNVLDLDADTEEYNSISLDTIKDIIQKLYSY
jgi:hypothetical protein